PVPPRPTLFPYTTLFRSPLVVGVPGRNKPGRLLRIEESRECRRVGEHQLADSSFQGRTQPAGEYKGVVVNRFRAPQDPQGIAFRSEEHTSELQSRENLVC